MQEVTGSTPICILQYKIVVAGDGWRDILLTKNAGTFAAHSEYEIKYPADFICRDSISEMGKIVDISSAYGLKYRHVYENSCRNNN